MCELETSSETGLSGPAAKLRLQQYGPNDLPKAVSISILKLFLSQFMSAIVGVLIGAALISGLLGDWIDTAAIITIVFLNGVFGFAQEYKAERSLAALRRMTITLTRVIRDGVLQSLPAQDIVPGDLIILESGDYVPADARLVYVANFKTQEASMTGESAPVTKSTALCLDADVPVGDRVNMVFMGTAVVSGKARALVVATGLRTELGRIAAIMETATKSKSAETPLQRRLEHFGYTVLWLALGVISVVFALGYIRGEPSMTMFLTAVSLAVAAVPEGLPAVVTITLALGVTRMAKRHALIRKLPAVEMLGSATVICTDKTGTLTKNEMTVTGLFAGGDRFTVSGEGYQPVGMISSDSGVMQGTNGQALPEVVRQLLTAGMLCNGATLREEEGTWKVFGDPTEGALLVAAAKASLTSKGLEPTHRFLGEVPFDAERKRMTVVMQTSEGPVAYVKGAPDMLINCCTSYMTRDGGVEPLTTGMRGAIRDVNSGFARDALRVLGLASRVCGPVPKTFREDELERDLVFLGLAAMKDPLRPEAKAAVGACREAGIFTVMITGDHKETAAVIAGELGIVAGMDGAVTGSELDRITQAELTACVDRVSVYARVSAEHKMRIVGAWKQRGAVVAMTGDGVNDAPAIKAADIGVAMGISGTDVAKEAADIVVTDDNFASIAAAVEEGRVVFDNIQKTVHFLLSCNMSEVLVMLFAALLGLPLPLLPIQILWMNLVTDGIPALALAVDPKAPDLMQRPPRNPEARLLDAGRLLAIAGEGLMLGSIALGAFSYSLFILHQDLSQARTVAFTVMVMAQLVHAFNCRSERLSLFQVGLGTNRALSGAFLLSGAAQLAMLTVPVVAPVFKVVSLPIEVWALMGAMSLLPLGVMEAVKWFRRRYDRVH
ncbi:Calcium-transporting ATPase [Nitrospira sp. KM1]|nr:Calcium-transporting ATPase [Nitrospira sp. KM1]